jgi:hypothetical protein
MIKGVGSMKDSRLQHGQIDTRATRPSSLSVFVVVLTLGLMMGCGPIGPFAGGRLSGAEGSWPVDWSTAAELPQIQLETAIEDPSSINVWVVVLDRKAFIATSLLMGPEVPDERGWVRDVLVDPRVRVRVDGVVYPARLMVLDDPDEIASVFEAFRMKYPELEEARGAAVRFYRIVKR